MSRSNGWHVASSAAWLAFVSLLLLARPSSAQPMARDDVPPDLVPWIGWALDGAGEEACTTVDGAATCVWPGRLALDATVGGARFELDVITEIRTRVPLPGSADLWPEDVKAGAEDAIVTEVDGVPYVWLPAGAHHVEGRIAWKTRPDLLPVPAAAGKVVLKLDGDAVATRWESEGKLWLTKDGTSVAPEDPAAKEQDRLELEVFRRIEDGVPLVVTTLLDLRVAGAPREVHLGKPVLGGVLLAVVANGLPIRMEGDGDMVVAIRAGKHRIELRERHATPPAELALEARPAPWPADEIWSFQPRLEQRQVEPTGIPSVDPSRTNAPAEWRGLQTFKAHAPAKLAMKTTRRGNPEPPPNKLELVRNIWLDASHGGYTVVDDVTGTMTRDYRLDFTGPGDLGNVVVRGGRDQLISVSSDRSLPGVELRDGNVSLSAEWRSEVALGSLPAIGWSTDVESLETTLHLPPGWDLVKVTGADGAFGEWGADWEVADFAILLAIALATSRVFSVRWGLLAAAALVAAHEGQPGLRWWIAAAVALAAIFKVASKEGRLARGARLGMRCAALVTAWLALGLAAREGQRALFPATENARQMELEMEEKEAEMVVASAADNKEGGTGTRAKGEEGSMGAPSTRPSGMRFGVRGPADEPAGKAAERSADEIVQTGHGVPRWEHRSAPLRFSGTVERSRMVHFYLLSPWQSAAVAFLRAGLVVALGWGLLREAFRPGGPRTSLRGAPYRAAGAAVATFVAIVLGAAPARADQPSPEMLAELKARLVRPPACAPACADVASMRLEERAGALVVSLRVHAEATSAVVLPGGADAWAPTRIEVDGKRAVSLRTQGGRLLLRVGRGTHDVELEGPVTATGFTLTLGSRPHRVRTALPRWSVEGLDDEGGPTGDALVFHKTGAAEDPSPDPAKKPGPEAPAETVSIPPWLEITRTLELGVTWTVTTVIKRVSDVGPPITLSIPILDGEKVVEGGARMEGAKVTVDLGRDAKEAKFVSAVAPRESVVLQATEKEPWSEQWVIRCSVIWQCRSEGVPPIDNRADGMLQATFRPWPGEKLTLHLVRPPPAKGISTTIDQAVLRLEPGESSTEASLSVAVRTTTGGAHAITLPEGARITSLTVNGAPQPSPDAAALRIPLSPGSSSIAISFKLDQGRGIFYRVPAIDLGGEATNARVEIVRPYDRMILWAGGGSWGPVVLLWPFMLLLAAIGVALSRLPGSPLTLRQWLVLAPGLTQAPAIAGALIVGWIFVVHHRRERERSSRLVDGMKQVGIAGFTFTAFMCFAACLYVGVSKPRNLLETEVWRQSNGSAGSSQLLWYWDRTTSALERPWVLSAPDGVWKVLMLAWAVAVFMALWPFIKAAAARYVEGGVFRKPDAVATAGAGVAGAVATVDAPPAAAPPTASPAAAPRTAAPTSTSAPPIEPATDGAPPDADDPDT